MIYLSKYHNNPATEPVGTEERPSGSPKRASRRIKEVFRLPVKAIALVLILLFAASLVQAANKFSVATGNWSATTTWSLTSGGASGAPVPVSGDVVTIEGGFTVTLNANMAATISSITISAGSTFATTSTYTVAATTITVNGTYINGSTGAIINTTMNVNSGATYQHNINAGTIPTATWNAASTCLITGVTSTTTPGGLTQVFGNLTWNCTGQGVNGNSLANANYTITGTLTIANTGTSGTVQLVRGAFIGNVVNYVQTGGTAVIGSGTASKTLNISGSFSLSSGTFNIDNGTGTVGPILNIGGNFTESGGVFTRTNAQAAVSQVNFNGSSTQTFSKTSGTISGKINFAIISGATVDFGTSILDGSTGTFTLNSGGSIITAHAQGISTTATTGCIQVTGTKTYNGGANYTYDASGAQATGNGLPTVAITGGVTISSGAIVTSTNAIIVNTPASLTINGTLTPGAIAQVFSGTGTLTGTGTVQVNRTAAIADFSSQYTETTKTLTGLTVEYTVLTGAQVVSSTTYNNLKLDNTSGTNTAGGAVVVNGTLTANGGTSGTLDMSTYTLTGTLGTVTNTGTINTQNTTSPPIATGKNWGGTVNYNGSTSQTVSSGTYSTLKINNTAGATLGGASTVSGSLTLTSGIISTTPTNLLSVTSNLPGAITGGSSSSYINGPVKWSLASGSSYTFPVGANSVYYPLALNSVTGSAPVLTVQAFAGSSGGSAGTGLCSISTTEYWQLSYNSGTFTNGNVSLTRVDPLSGLDAIAKSTTLNGSYTNLNGTASSPFITTSDNIGSLVSGSIFFAMAKRKPAITAMSATACSGVVFTVSPVNVTNGLVPSGTTYSWSAPTGSGFTGGASGNNAANVSGTLTNTTSGVATATYTITPLGACSGNTFTVTVDVSPAPSASVSGTTSVCPNATAPNISFTNPTTLPVTITYNINGSNQTTINVGASSSATIAAPTNISGIFAYNLVSMVYQSAPACTTAITGTATVTVEATPASPTLLSASPVSGSVVCVGYNTGTATFNAGSGGGIDEYSVSIDGGSNWSTYTNSAAIITDGGITSVQVRARRSGGSCAASAYTTYTIWTYGSAPVAPAISPASLPTGSAICVGYNLGSVTGDNGSGGSTGAAGEYQVSIDGGTTWSPYTNGSAISTIGATANIIVQARRTGGSYGCTSTGWNPICFWTLAQAIVSPAVNTVTPASGTQICAGYSVSATINGGSGGSTGAADLYEYSLNDGSNWSAYTSGAAINTTVATTSVQVRVSRTGGSYGCSPTGYTVIANWPIAPVNVSPSLNSATPSNGSTICTGYSPSATINPGTGGSAGATDLYEYSIDNGSTWATYVSGNPITTTFATGSVRIRVSRTAGTYGCSAISVNTIVTWPVSTGTVNPTLNVATPASGTSICAGYNGPSATITIGSGGSSSAADLYEKSIDNGVNWSSYTSGAAINATGATGNVLIRVSRSAGSYGCTATGPITIVTWPIALAPVSPTLGTANPVSGSYICAGFNTATVTGTGGSGGSGGSANEYQVSIYGGGGYSSYTSGAAISTTGATGSVIVQARRSSGSYGCSNTAWTTLSTWTVNPATVNPTLNVATPVNGTSICTGYNVSATITAGSGGSEGAADLYEYSIDGTNWSPYTSGTTINTAAATGSVQVRTRRSAGTYGCNATGPTTIVTWPVSTATAAPTLGSASPANGSSICVGFNTGTVTGTGGTGGSTGATNEYQVSINGGSSYSAYTSGATISTTGATGSVIVQARRTGGSYGCSTSAWSTICTWTVNPQPTITLSANPSVNRGTTIANMFYTATTFSPDQYSIDYNATANTAGFIDVTNATLGVSPIVLVVPAAPTEATYNGTLTVRNSTSGCVSTGYPITVTVTHGLLTASFMNASQASLNESGTITVAVLLSATSASVVTVPFSVNGASTATGGGTDYTITASPITIAAGQRTGAINIAITSDVLVEGNETVIINMGNPTNAIQGAIITHTATITDDDPYPQGSIAVNRGGISTVPASLVNNVLLKGCLTASNITFTGNSAQIGHFTNGSSSFPISEGIILSTGNVASAEGPNKDFGTTTQFGGAGDANINTITGGTSFDAAVLQFDFVPEGNTIQFNYVFASEEYAEFVGEVYNDAFAFLLSGPGITGTENIALIPSTSTAVSINNVHGQGNTFVTNYPSELYALVASNPSAFGPVWTKITDDANGYFGSTPTRYYYRITPVNNSGRTPLNAIYYVDNGQFKDRDVIASNGRRQIQYLNQSGQTGSSEMEFDGRTTVLTASHAVTACQTYHIKMVVADVYDDKWNSGVFLEAKSFTSNEVQISSHIGAISGDASSMYEGCEGSYIRFQRASGADNSEIFTFPIITSGTATNGVDYVYTNSGGTIIGDGTFPSSATLGIGVDFVDYYYKAQSDGLIEGNEAIIFRVSNGCPCDPSPTYLEKTVTIIDVPQIQASTVSVIQCVSAGNPVATITVNMQGGLNPNDYQFSRDGLDFQASNVFILNSAMPDGSDIVGTSHDITVKDQYSCNSITENNIIIPAIAPFNANAGSDLAMCEGLSGTQLNASGGIFYTWTCSPSNGTTYLSSTTVSNPTVSNTIPAGTYTFTVTAQNQLGADPSCTGTDNMVLTVNQKPVINVTTDNTVGCNGTAIHLNAAVTNGGASPTYLWNPITDLSSSTIGNPVYTPVVSSYQAQFFTVSVTGTNGCSSSANSPGIDVYPSPVITTGTIVNASCAASNGSATVSGSSPGTFPVPTFAYLWDAAAGNHVGATADNLAAGTYTVTVTDATHGCSNTKQVTVGSTADAVPPTAVCQSITVSLDGTGNVTITPTDINNGSSDNCTPSGSLILTLDKTTFNTSNVGDNTVTLTVKDLANNTSTCTANVHVNYSTTCGAGASRTIYNECFDAGTVNGGYTISGGSAYNIASSRMHVTQNTSTANFFLSNAKTISSYTNLNISVDVPAQANLDAGADPIQLWYSVDGGAFVQFANNGLMYGTWTGTSCSNVPDGASVRIKILCMQSSTNEYRDFDNVHLTGDPAMEATAAITEVSCNGGNNGAINVTVTKGVGALTYAWTTSNGSGLNATAKDQTGLTAGNYNLVVTDANGVLSNTFSFAVTQPLADPAITTGLIVTDAAACNPAGGDLIFTITSAQSGVHYELKTTGGASLNPVVTGTGTGSNLNLMILQANVPTSTNTYKVVATSASGCTWADLTHQPVLTVTTSTAPTGSAGQSFCSSSAPKVSTLSVTGTGIVWYNAASGGSVVASTVNLVNGTTYYASQTINGCESPSRLAVTATVYTTPTILSVTHGVICGSGTVTIHATASIGTVNWYAAQTGGSPIGTGNDFTTPNISTTNSYWVDGTNNGCTTSTRSEVFATVYALPTITLSAIPSVCFGAVTASLSYGVTTGGANQYSIAFDAAAIATGFTDVAFTTLPPSQISITIPGGAPAGTYSANLTVRNSANGCVSINYPISIGINVSTAILSQSTGAQSSCIGGTFAPISVTATGPGLSYQWYSNTVANNTGGTSLGSANGAQTNSYTPQAGITGTLYYYCTVSGTCGPAVTSTISGSFVVYSIPTATISGGSTPICYNTAPGTFTATGGGGNGTYTYLWYKNGISAGITTQTYSPGTLTATTAFYCAVTSGTCTPVNSNSISITVTPNNSITLTSAVGTNAQTRCISTAITNITYSTTGATDATFSGLPAGVNGSWGSNAVVISGTPTVAGSFSYTVALTGGCGSISASGTISVTPNNTITLSSAGGTDGQTKCINTPITNITYNTTGATGANFIGLPTGVTGSWTAGEVLISGTPTISGIFSYTVTLTGGCGSTTATGSINVSPNNTISLSSSAGTDAQSICISTPITNITYTTTGATGATFIGLPAGVSGDWASNTVTISGTPSVAGTYNYMVTLTGGCGSITANGAISVTPNNTITLTSGMGTNAQTKCINSAITNITYSTTGATGASVTGLPTGISGTWESNSVLISGTPTESGPFNYTVTLTGGCGSISANGTLIITPTVGTPTAIIVSAGVEPVCQLTNGSTTTTYATIATNNTGFNWSLSNGSAGSIGTSSGIMTWADGFSGTVNIQVTANGCNGPSAQVIRTVVVTPTVGTPIFESGIASIRCQGAGSVTYAASASNNTGLTYSLDAASITGGNSIIPSTGEVTYLAGWTGTSLITVTAAGCNGSSTATHTVTITPTVGTPTSITVYSGTEPSCQLTDAVTTTTYATTATNNTGFSWSISNPAAGSIGSTSGIMAWANGFSGSVNIEVVANGCNGPSIQIIRTVNITPTVGTPIFNLGASSTRCQGAGSVTYTATATNNTGITYMLDEASLAGGNSIDLSTGEVTYPADWSGTSAITVNAAGCNGPSISTHSVIITPTVGTPVFVLGPTSTRCKGAETVAYTALASNSTEIVYSLDPASETGGNNINPSNGEVTYVGTWFGTSTITATAAGCNGPKIASHVVTIIGNQVWIGAVSTDWNVIGNWSCTFFPDLTTNVLIPDVANKPILNGGDFGMAKDITIDAGSSVTIIGNTLQIAGTITNHGTFDATAGTIEMQGSAAQTIDANAFVPNTILHLTINNSVGVTLNGPLNVTGIVRAQSGNLNSGGNLTLVSSASQTALIDGSSAGNVLGNVTMQRYLPVAFGYKYVSSPFQDATVGQFTSHLNPNASFPTFYKYNENQLDGNGDDKVGGWVTYTDPLSSLIPMIGYAANFGPVPRVELVDLNGTVNNGNIGLTLFSHNRTYTKGFNLVGNPYPSPIDWDLLDLSNSSVDNAIYFFRAGTPSVDPNPVTAATENLDYQYLGVYKSYVHGISSYITNVTSDTDLHSNRIASMQGFLVHVNGAGTVETTLNFTNAIRTTDLTPALKTAPADYRSILRFSANYETANAFEDDAVIYFESGARQAFDRDKDALKMLNTDPKVPNLYSFSLESKQLSINGMPILTDSTTEIPLGLNLLSDGSIVFKAQDISTLPFYLHLYLLDAEKAVIQDLQQYPEYRFNLKKGEYNQRFSLIFSLTEITDPAAITKNLFKIIRSTDYLLARVTLPYNTRGTFMVTSMSGQVVMSQEVFGSQTVPIDLNVTAGLYIVTVISGNRAQSEKLLMRLNYE